MYGQAHAGLGWMIGTLAPGSDRRLRAWCTASALLPDIDAVMIVFGHDEYVRWHHTFGHNVFLGGLAAAAAWRHHRDRPVLRRLYAALLVAACFASHMLTDAKLSGWYLRPFWPASGWEWQFAPNYGLDFPLNEWLVYFFLVAIVPLAWLRGATPLEILSARLDRLVMNAFRPKTLACADCARRCNETCEGCAKPVCMKHGKIRGWFRVRCAGCAAGFREPAEPGPEARP